MTPPPGRVDFAAAADPAGASVAHDEECRVVSAVDYGNSLRTVGRMTAVGAVLGLLSVLAAISGVTVAGRWEQAQPGYLLLLFLPAPAVLGLVGLLTAAFRVRLTADTVLHLFLGRFVLSEYSVRDFLRLEPMPPVLVFRGGRRMRLVGMHLKTLAELEWALLARRAELCGAGDQVRR